MDATLPIFSHRSCYVNCAEHLQNAWNVNIMYPTAPGLWSDGQWSAFIDQIKSFGYNCFEFWIPPTLAVPGDARARAAVAIRRLMDLLHQKGMRFKPLFSVNCLGAQWYHACPNDPADRARILEVWEFWGTALKGADIFAIFPGDPGGCNRNGCTHVTFIELATELTELLKRVSSASVIEIGTWGTPFSGWGEDMWTVADWDGSFRMISDSRYKTEEMPIYIWNRKPQQIEACMRDLIDRLDRFPEDTLFAINMGFNPDSEPDGVDDGSLWAMEVAKKRGVTSWDYSLSEGELINYPHWRLPRMASKRLAELRTGAYIGGMCYTMTPMLNQLSLYAGGQLLMDPYRTADELASEFTRLVFGDPEIGLLMESFEIVKGWGHYPRKMFEKPQLQANFTQLIDRLESCRGYSSKLPIFPDPEIYRGDLLWHAHNFRELAGDAPDRNKIRAEYWKKALSIYDAIPMSADERAGHAANGYAGICK